MNSLESGTWRRKRARIAVAALYFIGMTAIVAWSLPRAAPANPGVESAMQMSDREVSDTAVDRPPPVPATRGARNRANCDGCGVIESVRRIYGRVQIIQWCTVGNSADTRIPGNEVAGDERADLASLSDSVAGAIAGDRPTRKFRMTTRHRIVVRFHDGTRQVFDEDSPRTLREGERIQVIAGSDGAKG